MEDAGVDGMIILTLRLLISYIYGAPSKATNANVVYTYVHIYMYIWTYVWQLAGKVFTHKCDTGNLSALIQC